MSATADSAAHVLDAEDAARAGHYALLSRLFYAAPDAALLKALGNADASGDGIETADEAPLSVALRKLAAAAAGMDAEAARAEYENVFVGIGKAEITLYASHYLRKSAPDRLLVQLREELGRLGLARKGDAQEPEDHLAALCDVMRYLISHDGIKVNPDVALQQQKQFFLAYISPCYAQFCVAVAASSQTNFYKHVATFAKVFFEIEAEAFQLS